MISQYKEDLQKEAATVDYARAFLRLVNVFRNAKKDDILKLLKQEDNEDIV